MSSTSRSGRLAGMFLAALMAGAGQSAHAQAAATLTPFPRASEYARHINPLEQGTLPISPPERKSGGGKQSRWRMSYEGAVSVLQYDHKNDDSPLLVARHYAGQLKAQGYELVTICDMPCQAPDGSTDSSMSWRDELDMTRQKLDLYRFGNRGLYFMAYKPDAIAAVRVGQFGERPVSTVKLVQSPNLDLGPLKAWIAQQQAPTPAAALPPPPQRSASAAPVAEPPAGPPKIVDIAPKDLAKWLAEHPKQRAVLQVTSFDPNCGHCARANPVYAALSSRPVPEGTVFLRMSFQPWQSVGQSPVAQQLGVNGLPTYLVIEGGQQTRRRNGDWDEATLRRELID
ncbi:thioredoxin family protein [Roseateles sp. DB2]|uniref:thioredoxin family protein n=1 Tax=Roseateles sp. DB2 TaxID=3453717 RepID=UPI003EE983DF